MGTYIALRTKIANETLRTDLLTEIGDAIQTAIREYEARRFWFNEATYQTTTTTGDHVISPPANLVKVDFLECVDGGDRYKLKAIDYEEFRAITGGSTETTGAPTRWSAYREKLLVYPTPDAAYTLWLNYVKSLSALSADSDSNAWTTEAVDLIRCAAKRILYTDVIDDERRAAIAQSQENRALAALQKRSTARVATGGGRLRATRM